MSAITGENFSPGRYSIKGSSREIFSAGESANAPFFSGSFIVGLIAFLSRAVYVAVQTKTGFASGAFYATDSHLYDALAQGLVSGQGFVYGGTPTAYVTPGYPAFLALSYLLVGRNFLVIGLIQSALGGLTAALIYTVARRIFNREVGWVAGLICALMPELVIATSGQILTEPFYTFLLALLIYSAIHLLRLNKERMRLGEGLSRADFQSILVGLIIGLATLTRPVALGFGVCLLFYVWRRTGIRYAALMGIGLILLVGPWAYRNYVRLGTPMLTTETGWVLYLYHGDASRGENGGFDPHVAPLPETANLTEVEKNRHYMHSVFSYAWRNPGRELKLTAARFWNMWRPTFAAASLRNRVVAVLSYLPLMLFAIPCALLLRFRNPFVGVLTLFLAYHLLFHLFVAAELRFRIPLEPVLAIFAAFGAVYTFRSFFPVKPTAEDVGANTEDETVASGMKEAGLRVSVIVPAFNEATRIESVLRKIASVPITKEVIVINDGSTDETAEKLAACLHLYDKLYDMPQNSGKGAAVLKGVSEATGDVVVVQDADGELDPNDYPILLAPFVYEDVEVVFGSRFLAGAPGSKRPPVPRINRYANRVLTGATNFLFRSSLTDMETGFKMCRSKRLESLGLGATRYEFEPEMTARLLKRGIPIHEVPVGYYPRPQEEKSIGTRDGLLALWVLIRIRFLRR